MEVPDIAFAAVLGFAALLAILVSQRACGRDYLRFAAALYAALAVADVIAAMDATTVAFAASVTLVIGALAPCALMLALASAFAHPPRAIVAAPLLVIAAAAGIFAAMTGAVFAAFAPLFACVCAMLVLAARRGTAMPAAQAALSAFALLAAAAAFMTGAEGRTAFALFSAAGLMGTALACASRGGVEQQRARRGGANAIRALH